MRKGHFTRSAALGVALSGCVSLLAVGCGGGEGTTPSKSSGNDTGGLPGSTGGSGTNPNATGGSGGNTASSTGGRSTGTGGFTTGSGGATTGAGGSTAGSGGSQTASGGAANDCRNANDTGGDTDCTSFGAGYVCDRSDSTRDPRVCTCTDDGSGSLDWVCVHENTGTGGAENAETGGATATAGTGPTELDCRVNDTGGDTDCADYGAGYVCDRSDSQNDPRVCTCTDDGSGGLDWVCVHENAGTAGAGSTGTGGATATAGAGPTELDCRVNDTGGDTDCTDYGAGYVCDRLDSQSDPRVCTCTDDGSGSLDWVCVHEEDGTAGAGSTTMGGAAGDGNTEPPSFGGIGGTGG